MMNLPFDNDIAAEFSNLCQAEPMEFGGTKYASLMDLFKANLKIDEDPGVDMFKTFGKGTAKSFTDYVIGGFMVLSPLDILSCQDQLSGTNWLAQFAKFCEINNAEKTYVIHWQLPWLFCLTHMIHENLVREGEDGALSQMQGLSLIHI